MSLADVLVTFYDNPVQVDKSDVSIINVGGITQDLEGYLHRRIRVRVQGTGGGYTLGISSNFFTVPPGPPPTVRNTSGLSAGASASNIASAFNSISVTEPNKDAWLWTPISDEDTEDGSVHDLDVRSALVGGQHKLPDGFVTDGSGLSGFLIWEWDEISHEIEIEKGGCGGELPQGEVHPEGVRSGKVPKRQRVRGGRVGEPEKRSSVLPGHRRSPN